MLPLAAAALAATAGAVWTPVHASSHREAPYIATQPKADGTDCYLVHSYGTGRDGQVTRLAA
jgi:hypothetical protein